VIAGENTVSCRARVVLIIWLFVVLILTSSYTASLTSILTVQKLSSSINGIDSLRANDEPIGYQVGSFVQQYLTEERHIDESRLVGLNSPEEYADALRQGRVSAIVDEHPYIELFLSSQCDFRIVGEEFTRGGWGFVSISCSFLFHLCQNSMLLGFFLSALVQILGAKNT